MLVIQRYEQISNQTCLWKLLKGESHHAYPKNAISMGSVSASPLTYLTNCSDCALLLLSSVMESQFTDLGTDKHARLQSTVQLISCNMMRCTRPTEDWSAAKKQLQTTCKNGALGRNPSKGTIIDRTGQQSQKAKGWLCVQVDATSKLRSVTSSEVFNSHIAYSVSGL